MLISSMVPPEASACMLWGGMSSCAQYHSNNGLERLVLRSAPHVFRRGRYNSSTLGLTHSNALYLLAKQHA